MIYVWNENKLYDMSLEEYENMVNKTGIYLSQFGKMLITINKEE